jgi:hypothetical protein
MSATRLGLALAASGVFCAALHAQGVRITGTTITRFVEIRPLVRDSVPLDSTSGTGTVRESTRGVAVQCAPGELFCRYLRSANESASTTSLIQDLEASAWGFGTGIRAYAHLRGRAANSAADDLWPQADDAMDVLDAYLEVDRGRFRGRAGRQWRTSGLGYYNFDGLALAVRLIDRLTIDAFGGWSLVRGLNESHTSGAIAAVEEIPPDDRALIFGIALRGQPTRRLSLAGTYQREYRSDRTGFYADRVSADADLRLGRVASVSASVEADLATEEINEALLRGRVPLPRGLTLVAEARRHVPFFELWTIWGAFSPVGYTEGNATLSWSDMRSRLLLQARGGWRRYEETDAGLTFLPIEREGWRIGADGTWRPTDQWTVFAATHAELGFGAARSDADAGVRWEPSRRLFVGARVAGFQSAYELRVGEGRVFAFGLDGGTRLGQQVRILGDVTMYQHEASGGAPFTDWSQTRASLRLEWTIGRDPGEPEDDS